MTDQELILARAWALLVEPERDAIESALDLHGRARLDKLAADWIEILRAEKGVEGKKSNVIPFKKGKKK